jgi:hypothetical protein
MRPQGESEDQSGLGNGTTEGGNDDAVARMRRAIDASRHGGPRSELEAAAIQLVLELKRANQPPEQMLLRMKALLADAGLRPSLLEAGATTELEASLYRDVIAWSIRHYYAERDAAQ